MLVRTFLLLHVAFGIRTGSTAEILKEVFFRSEEVAPTTVPAWVSAPSPDDACNLGTHLQAGPPLNVSTSPPDALQGKQPFLAPHTGTFIHGCSSSTLSVVIPCETAPMVGAGAAVHPALPWILRVMLGFSNLKLACLEDLHGKIASSSTKPSDKSLVAEYVHSGSVMILTSSKYAMGVEVAANTSLSNLTLIHIDDLSSTWAQEYRRWRFVFRTFWTDDSSGSYNQLMLKGRLAYFPLGPEPQLLWHGQKHMRNASERRLKIFFAGAKQRRVGRLQQAQNVLGKDLVIETTGDEAFRSSYDHHYVEQLFNSALCLQIPGPSIESYRLFESLEAGCIPVVVRSWGGEGEALAKLQVGDESLPFLYVQAPEDLRQVLQLNGVQLDTLQAQSQEWWKSAKIHFRTRFAEILRPQRTTATSRQWDLKLASALAVFYVALGCGAMVFFGTKGKEASTLKPSELSVEVARFLFVMMIIFQHFWVASLQLEREESTVWKLVVISGFLTARAEIHPWRRYFHHRFIGPEASRLVWYLLMMLLSSWMAHALDLMSILGIRTWQVPWKPKCTHLNVNQCPAYRMNGPIWLLPGLFLCWLLYPLLSMAVARIHCIQQANMPWAPSWILLSCSAKCYWLSMAFLELPFQSFPPLLLAPFCFGVFAHEWLSTLTLPQETATVESWRTRLQLILPWSVLMSSLMPGLPNAWNLPALLPLFLPVNDAKKAIRLPSTRREEQWQLFRSIVLKLGRCSSTCFMFQLPVAQLMMYIWEFVDLSGIAYPSSLEQVGRESFLSKYPQMRTESFFVYLVVLWSLGLLSLRWPARIQHQDA